MKKDYVVYHKKDYDFLNGWYFYQFVKNKKYTDINHSHDFYEIIYVINGTVTKNIDGSTIKMKKCDFIILSPGDTHFFKAQSDDAFIFSLSVDVNRFGEIKHFMNAPETSIKIYPDEDNYIFQKIERLIYAETNSRLNIVSDIIMLMFMSLDNIDTDTHDSNIIILKKALAEIKKPDNLSGGVNRLASLSGFSRMHLNRLVKKYYNSTPHKLIIKIKMDIAVELLKSTNLTIEQIAEYTCFDSVSHFYCVFKAFFGISPAKYKKQLIQSSNTYPI